MNSIYLAATVAMVAGLSTYAPVTESGQEQIPYLPTPQPIAAQSATVSGCVAQGTVADTYVLTGVVRDVEPTAPATTPVPMAPVPVVKEGSKSATLLLTGSDVDMSKHVGHKVSVTGTDTAAADRPIGTSGSTDAKPGTDSATAKADAKVPAGFAVKSLKMISGSCTEAGV
jgi:hypothetical protein